jgi:hypothetical protein
MERWGSTGTARSARRFTLVALLGVLAAAVWGAYAVFAASAPPAPTITGKTPSVSPTNSTAISFTFTDSQSGVTFQCSLDGSSFTACSSPKSYSSLGSGSHSFQVQAVSGGKASSSASYTWVVDTAAPSVSSINRSDASPTKAASLHWTVTFSEPVANVTAANFAAVTSGTGGAPSVTSATPSGSAPTATWTVTIATAGTTGGDAATIGLNLSIKGSIQDAAGNPLGGSVPVVGQTYAFDTQAPTTTSITRVSPALTNAGSVSWTVAFSEPVTGVASSNFSLAQGGGITGTPTITGVSGSGSSRTVTASTGSSTPASGAAVSLQLNLSTVTGISDPVGNVLASGLNGTASAYQVDKVVPSPVLDSKPPDPNSVSTSNFTWHDGETGVMYLCSTENGSFVGTVHGADGPDQPCASPLAYVVQTTNNGQHQFAVEAVDAAGNVSPAVVYSWKVAKGSIQDFTMDGGAIGLLYPGGAARTIAVTLHNPNDIPIFVTAVAVAVHGSDLPAGCTGADFQLVQATIPAAGVQVPANGSVTLPAQGSTAPTVQMVNRQDVHPGDGTGNQNACRNATFQLDFSGSAHS